MAMLVAAFCGRPDTWPTELPEPLTDSDPILANNLTLITGAILLLLGILNLGFIVNFISHAVIVGFCSAAAILISCSQVKKLFGIKLHSREIFHYVPELFTEIYHGKTNWYDFAMGIVCLIILKSFELLKRKYQNDEKLNPVLSKVIWLVGTARNAIVVITAGVIAYCIEHENIDYWNEGCRPGAVDVNGTAIPCTTLTLTKIKDASMPPFAPPPFSYSYNISNQTGVEEPAVTGVFNIGYVEIIKGIGTGMFIIPLMAYLESISIAKGFGIKNDYKVDATQELVNIQHK